MKPLSTPRLRGGWPGVTSIALAAILMAAPGPDLREHVTALGVAAFEGNHLVALAGQSCVPTIESDGCVKEL